MSEQHSSSRKTLMFNTAAFLIASGYFAISLIWSITASGLFSFSTIAYLIGYVVLGLLQFFGAWKAFGQMNYAQARNKGFLSWLWIVVVAIIKLFF